MNRRKFIGDVAYVCGAVLLPQFAAHAQTEKPKRKPDLGDAAEGKYFGGVTSDSKGSSRSDVTLTVTRVGVNVVRISSDYARLPVVDIALTRAMDKIVQARGETPFVLDRSSNPPRLDVSFRNEVSWSGSKQ